MMSETELLERVAVSPSLLLFLDYDGTLAEFAPTPDHIEPRAEVAALLERLSGLTGVRTAIVSGRRLAAIETLVPVEGVTIAGSYGVEIRHSDGKRTNRLQKDEVRPFLDRIKPGWEQLLAGRRGFFLEDKVWSVALHARFAEAGEAERVLAAARSMAERMELPDSFRLLGGERFLEIAPRAANKADAVRYLFKMLGAGPERESGWMPLYIGDDDKDLEAFEPVHRFGGYAALVGEREFEEGEVPDCRFADPESVRRWLDSLAERRSARHGMNGASAKRGGTAGG